VASAAATAVAYSLSLPTVFHTLAHAVQRAWQRSVDIGAPGQQHGLGCVAAL